ncbi:MAG: protein phosphatase CheZ [Gammaproteobacteria bacterium]
MNSAAVEDPSLALARRLVDAIESGDSRGAGDLLEALNDGRFEALFREIGKLTRELHDTFGNLATDERLVALAHEHMPDARERLNYVVAKTEEAADRTLGAAEAMQAVNDDVLGGARALRATLGAGDPAAARAATEEFLDRIEHAGGTLRGHLTEVMLAQEYQDLTGQVIKRTIGLVNQVEEKLVGLVSACGAVTRAEAAATNAEQSHGPAVHVDEQVVTRQADVDELLANLGF